MRIHIMYYIRIHMKRYQLSRYYHQATVIFLGFVYHATQPLVPLKRSLSGATQRSLSNNTSRTVLSEAFLFLSIHMRGPILLTCVYFGALLLS